MDDTLTNLSLEPMIVVTKLNRKSLRALENSTHNVPQRKTRSLKGRPQCSYMCHVSTEGERCKVQDVRNVRNVRDVRDVRGVRGVRGVRDVRGVRGVKKRCKKGC